MQNSNYSRYSPARSSQIKTQNTETQAKSNLAYSQAYISARNHQKNQCIDIQIHKSKVSQQQGFSSVKLASNNQAEQSSAVKQKSKYVIFKNLQQFQRQLKTQKGMIQKGSSELKAFGITTFRGLRHSINNHQISAHIGEPTSFTLMQGFDGHFAASQMKKIFSNELNLSFRKQTKSSKEEPFRSMEQSIKSAFQHSKKQLSILQSNLGDNSGACFLSTISQKGITFVANCGSSGTLCMTTSGKLLQLAKPHTTNNQNELNRIIQEGGQLFQTTVNFPYQRQMGIRGPLRVYPEGLTLTRTVGRSLSNSKKKQKIVSELHSHRKGVLSQLQINYVPSSQIRWLAILSSKVVEKVKSIRIKDLIEQQLSKCCESYLTNEAIEHSTKRIVLQATQLGANESLSCLVLLGKFQQNQAVAHQKKQSWQSNVSAKQKDTLKKLAPQPKSLTYIGKRINFVQLQKDS